MSNRTSYLHASGQQIRNLRELEHDPYHARKKLPEPTRCPDCGAIFHDGHWQWGQAPAGAHETLCPACHRIHDHCPAGFLILSGALLVEHREDILRLLRHVEQREKAEHVLHRLIAMEEQTDGSLLITFTDPHLARASGEAVHDAFKGELHFQYVAGEFLLRVTWTG